MKTLKLLATLLFFSLKSTEQMKLSYKLQKEGNKNFLVINSDDQDDASKKQTIKRKKNHRKL